MRIVTPDFPMYERIAKITNWLNKSNEFVVDKQVDAMSRLLKIQEEAGEVAQAYIGYIGQNPRKGFTHSREDVINELADVVVTALCAMQYFTNDADTTKAYMINKINSIIERAGIDG